jgi:hypothetical protein
VVYGILAREWAANQSDDGTPRSSGWKPT